MKINKLNFKQDKTSSQILVSRVSSLMSRIEHKYCLISTSYLTALFEIFILPLPMRTLCDAYHKEFESN